MRRVAVAAAAIIGAVVIFAGAILFYAASNLSAIIAERREAILDKLSASLGRQVHVDEIKVRFGWGILADVTGVQVADDPDISKKPFIEASDVYTRLELIPLLAREIRITEVVLDKPVIRIVQTRDGVLNVSTLGRKKIATEEKPGEGGKAEGTEGRGVVGGSPMAEARRAHKSLPSLFVRNFTIDSGTLTFQAEGAAEPATINAIDARVRDFGFKEPFTVAVTLAALGDQQNFDLSATIGPLVNQGVIDVDAIPLSATAKVGPISIAQLETVAMLKKAIPEKLSISAPFSFDASADGTFQSIKFNVSSDLSAPAIVFGDAFNKPADQPFKITAVGSRTGSAVGVTLADVTLGDLEMKAANVKLGGGATSARIDTNNFDITSLAKMAPAISKYNFQGKGEIHSDVAVSGGKASADGTVALAGVGLTIPGQKAPLLTNLSGIVKLTGTSADIGPMTFSLGASQANATLKSHVDQFQPLVMSYELNAPSIRLADLAPSRPPDEAINQLYAKGAVSAASMANPSIDCDLTSPSGKLANVPYQDLKLSLSLGDKSARVAALKVKAFSGDVVATGNSGLSAGAPMAASVSFSNIDLEQALESQKSKAAGTVRGALGGNIDVSGKIGSFDEMKPTLKGSGKLMLINGKLVGVNIGGEALRKVNKLPLIGDLVPDAVAKNHPELFNNPDTDIQLASLSFVLAGPRITSHDIKVETVDYNLLGDGWFDMDKNIDLAARIVLSAQFSKELVEQKKAVGYITNKDGQVDFPLEVVGRLPKPKVVPDVTELAQRAANHAAQAQGQKYLGKIFGKKGLPGGLQKLFGN